MTAIDARELTLSLGDGSEPENFTEIGGLQNVRIALRNNNATHHHAALSHSWQHGLDQTGQQSVSISGQGIFTDSTSEVSLRNQAFANEIGNFQIELGNGDLITGAFFIRNFEHNAAMEDAVRYNISLQSAGEIAFEIAAT